MKKIGKHLILDIYDCKILPNHSQIYDLLEGLAKRINMKMLTKPYIVKGEIYNPGLTGFVIIETSHISIHTFEQKNYIAMDIYSCLNFKHQVILKELKKYFNTTNIDYKVFRR